MEFANKILSLNFKQKDHSISTLAQLVAFNLFRQKSEAYRTTAPSSSLIIIIIIIHPPTLNI